jgi:hypothetical protein
MLFDTLLPVVFLRYSFSPHKNYPRNLFRANFAQKVLFGKVPNWPCDIYQCAIIITGKSRFSALREKKERS